MLSSVLNQEYSNYEVIIIDNKSVDDTLKVISDICRRYKNCKIFPLKRNYGWCGGVNRGAIVGKYAKYFFILNDDVILGKSCISKLVQILEDNEKVGAAQPILINKDGTCICSFWLGISGLPKPSLDNNIFYVSGGALLLKEIYFSR